MTWSKREKKNDNNIKHKRTTVKMYSNHDLLIFISKWIVTFGDSKKYMEIKRFMNGCRARNARHFAVLLVIFRFIRNGFVFVCICFRSFLPIQYREQSAILFTNTETMAINCQQTSEWNGEKKTPTTKNQILITHRQIKDGPDRTFKNMTHYHITASTFSIKSLWFAQFAISWMSQFDRLQ